tara:strand:+ start:2156 stop:3883 length:1728 start_codon:yes stop_codon:yes gene_type:complete
VFDVETSTPQGKPNPLVDKFKYLGAYDLKEKKYYFISDKKEGRDLLRKHKIVIGFNSKKYDEPILKREQMWTNGHIHIDLFEVVDKRKHFLKCKNKSRSLASLAKIFGLSEGKGELDYSLLNKESVTDEEYELIKKYTLQDIKVTKEMFEYLYKFFEPFKEYMSDYDIKTYKWLTSAISVYAYKVICNLTGLKEEYDDSDGVGYKGGFVAEPEVDEEHGKIYCMDFNSLYPHCFIQGNLYSHSCKCCDDKWTGNELFPVKGGYCRMKQGDIERLLFKFYKQRIQFKKEKDNREYLIKIIINSIYGLSGSPTFKSLFNQNTASDCTLIARRCCKLARDKFRSAGYKILYSDTDSVYLKDLHDDKERMLMVKDNIIKIIKQNLPFPCHTFDMGIDEEIKHIWFFKKTGRKLKKHYMYVTKNNKVKVKGLPMIKRDSSRLGLIVFNKYMKEKIKSGKIKFKYGDLRKWAYEELANDINVVARTFMVGSLKSYKNGTQLQAQISKVYGSGKHILIPNKYTGVGKSVKYCTINEFKKSGFNVNAISLNKYWSEMEFFSEFIPKKDNIKKGMISLEAWCDV